MKLSIKILISLSVILPFITSCNKYDDYMTDYSFSAVYFASQKPLRTIVARDTMTFKFGVALGGKRENSVDEWAKFEVDPELLNTVPGADQFTLMPSEYYTLSNDNKFTISAGKFIGDVTVTLNRDLFTADPEAIKNTYAIPVKITDTSADSILSGNAVTPAKDYSIIVVKYESPFTGSYYQKGTQEELDSSGTVVDTVNYNEADLSKNRVVSFTTLGLNIIQSDAVGVQASSGSKSNGFVLEVNSDNSVSISTASGSASTISEGSGQYDPEKKEFSLAYKYSNNGKDYNVKETLVLRQDPELDLRFEEW